MGYSFYEVYITALRAFSGMGFPHGADEDAAFIIAWLELNNLQGIKRLSDSISILDNQFEGILNIKDNDQEIDLNHQSILMKGSGIIDYFSSLLESREKIILTLVNCSDPFLFLPLLYKSSSQILFSQLIFYHSENEINIYHISKKKILIGKLNTKHLLKKNQVKIILSNKKNISIIDNIEKEISNKSIQKNLALSLEPDKTAWDKISKIANRIFVPESEESRNRGAGGGDDND